MNREQTTRTPYNEKQVLSIAKVHPSTNSRMISQKVGVLYATAWKILLENQMSPNHLQSVQKLQPKEYPLRKTFAELYLQQIATDNKFVASVMFSDEATFRRKESFIKHNAHVWALTNLHGTRLHAAQNRFSINVCVGILGNYLMGPYILPCRLN